MGENNFLHAFAEKKNWAKYTNIAQMFFFCLFHSLFLLHVTYVTYIAVQAYSVPILWQNNVWFAHFCLVPCLFTYSLSSYRRMNECEQWHHFCNKCTFMILSFMQPCGRNSSRTCELLLWLKMKRNTHTHTNEKDLRFCKKCTR